MPLRRDFLRLAASLAAPLLSPLPSLAAQAKRVRITNIESYLLRLPASSARPVTYPITRVHTDAGITGTSFIACPRDILERWVKPTLAGRDLFAIDRHMNRLQMERGESGVQIWSGVEHALWDAVGRVAGQPVARLLGGNRDRLRVYRTCVFPGKQDQSDVSYDTQAAFAVRLKKAGYQGMKIRAWRPRPLDDVDAVGVIRAAAGPDFHIMLDRTAVRPGWVWDYPTALQVCRGLEKHKAYWLEEPFARDDYETPARLAAAVDLLITGGEGYTSLEPFRQCLLRRTYDVVQPDGRNAGGIFMCRKTAMLAESFHVPCILHGTMSLMLAGWLQATLAIGCPWQEVALVTPPLLPAEQWEPALKVLRGKTLFDVRDGYLLAPPYPGLGLDIDEDALEKYRVKS